MERTIYALHNAGRRDLLMLLVEQRLSLEALHEAYEKHGDELEQLVAKAESPEVGGLVTRWFEWLESANGVSPRTRRRYAANTIYRYKESWAKLFAVLPNGRAARLTGLEFAEIETIMRMWDRNQAAFVALADDWLERRRVPQPEPANVSWDGPERTARQTLVQKVERRLVA